MKRSNHSSNRLRIFFAYWYLILYIYYSTGNNLLYGVDGNDSLSGSGFLYNDYDGGFFTASGKNTLNGGVGDD
nr:hypothetical protein [Nostoc sp. DedQUE02]